MKTEEKRREENFLPIRPFNFAENYSVCFFASFFVFYGIFIIRIIPDSGQSKKKKKNIKFVVQSHLLNKIALNNWTCTMYYTKSSRYLNKNDDNSPTQEPQTQIRGRNTKKKQKHKNTRMNNNNERFRMCEFFDEIQKKLKKLRNDTRTKCTKTVTCGKWKKCTR